MSKLFISGGTVIDPETLRRFRADVLCDGEKIEAIFPNGCDAPCVKRQASQTPLSPPHAHRRM